MHKVEYRIYVVELSKRVFTENAKFRAANPQFNGVLECLYVGMTSKTPKERFLQHKTGHRNKKGYKIVGDADFSSIVNKVSAISPVPGGVGPMTIAMLVDNTIESAEKIL